MNITMVSTQKGSEDGIRIKEYVEGVEYPLGATPGQIDLAQAFVAAGMAVEQGAPQNTVEDADSTDQPVAAKKPKASK